MKYFGATDIGQYRTENQDSFLVGKLFDDCVLAVVCDGMGGAAGGKIASSVAAKIFFTTVKEKISSLINSENDISVETSVIIDNILHEAVIKANKKVYGQAKDSIDLIGMGTTLVAALVIGKFVFACNVGDSRIYYFNIKEMQQITKDHSYVQMLIDTGRLLPQFADAHPDKNIITRAIGTEDSVFPDIYHLTLDRDETILLCSDGLSNFVTNEVIYSIIWGTTAIFAEDTEIKVKKLIDSANANQGRDNITAVLITY